MSIEITAPLQSTEFVVVPEGPTVAVCYGVVLYGSLQTRFGMKKKIRLMFELHGEERMPDGRLFAISSDFTFSSNEKASLRVFIEDWRGRKYTTADLKEMKGLPISKLIGQPAFLSISHTPDDDGRVWANIKTIMPMPKNMPAPTLINEKIIYSVDDHDADVFAKLPVKFQDKIKDSEEWKHRTGVAPMGGGASNQIPYDFDDEIPF